MPEIVVLMSDSLAAEALAMLRRLTGDASSTFRDGQLEVIRGLVEDRQRMLLVQRTGWGKSAVYFIATRMLRDRGAGPTLLVSPLLALIRNQIQAAQRMGVRAATINGENYEDWKEIEWQLEAGEVDLLLISPERLAKPQFRSDILPEVGRRSGLLVIDEAYCISDWGHYFRPAYRQLAGVLDLLPTGIPVLCCTVSANKRVLDDITSELGSDLALVRGPLARDGLYLAALEMPEQATRLAWLANQIPKLPGTGIVFCVRVADTQRVAEWLQINGISAVAYSGSTNSEQRVRIEQDLLSNQLKVVVATSALGMGFDKPDLAFVIHYQPPGSPVAYYQQVGRAGTALPKSLGILLSVAEETNRQDYFIRSAFPDLYLAEQVVTFLENRPDFTSGKEILEEVNVEWKELEKLLKTLEAEGAVERESTKREGMESENTGWRRTSKPWAYDHRRARSVIALRRTEQAQMRQYIRAKGCRMQLLSRFLDDPAGETCGICDNCSDAAHTLKALPSPEEEQRAERYLRSGSAELLIKPLKQLPDGTKIAEDRRLEVGRVLSVWGDGGWSDLVRSGKQVDGHFDDRLVGDAADLIRNRWRPNPPPTWVTYAPSLRNLTLVPDFAESLAESLGLPCEDVVVKVRETEPQKTLENSQQQYGNVRGAFKVFTPVPGGAVLLVDDIVDSRWTLTVIGYELRAAGVSHVYPFALADTARRSLT
ncbi:RecQ family ATP-dependent DNA helicase [Candidatus Poriferisocius sp.]|uniref:RecQ family ATP-dependent DNA helicase n=1 Tax=Candidatus Poriferisocius sp. TaxID=3101276 RepID=UPI003B0239D6